MSELSLETKIEIYMLSMDLDAIQIAEKLNIPIEAVLNMFHSFYDQWRIDAFNFLNKDPNSDGLTFNQDEKLPDLLIDVLKKI